MGLRLAMSTRWPVLLVLLVIAVVLTGGIPPLAQAQAPGYPPDYPKLPTGIKVEFDPRTPPKEPGKICKEVPYRILASPWVADLHGNQRQSWLFGNRHGKVSVSSALRGTITPSEVPLKPYEAPAVFVYTADDTGLEGLKFHATVPQPEYDPGVEPGWLGWFQTADENFRFEVIDCQPKVAMSYVLQFSIGSVVGYLPETPLASKADGTLEGSASFDFQQVVNLPFCSVQYSAINAPTHVTGTIDAHAHAIDLKFEYGKTQSTEVVTCPYLGSRTVTHNIDVASLGVTGAHFPEQGGAKTFPALGGQLTVIVRQDGSPAAGG